MLSFDDEEQLWKAGVLGIKTPDILVNTVVYMVGLHCCLHAGKECRSVCSPGFNSQFTFRYIDGVCHIEYHEDIGLKTTKGWLKSQA